MPTKCISRTTEPAAQASSGSAASPASLATSSEFDTVTPTSRIGFSPGSTLKAIALDSSSNSESGVQSSTR